MDVNSYTVSLDVTSWSAHVRSCVWVRVSALQVDLKWGHQPAPLSGANAFSMRSAAD